MICGRIGGGGGSVGGDGDDGDGDVVGGDGSGGSDSVSDDGGRVTRRLWSCPKYPSRPSERQ